MKLNAIKRECLSFFVFLYKESKILSNSEHEEFFTIQHFSEIFGSCDLTGRERAVQTLADQREESLLKSSAHFTHYSEVVIEWWRPS